MIQRKYIHFNGIHFVSSFVDCILTLILERLSCICARLHATLLIAFALHHMHV